ncbi:hypothetical protein SOP83_16820, partial [Kocuria rosea]|nr:hypothetical protein [Kocuria rosea]
AEAEAPGAGDPQAVFRRAVELATAGTGHPGAAGAIAGAVTGAALGTAALPPEWRARLDAGDVVSETAERWLREVGAPPAA